MKVLIVRLSAIGDVVQGIPCLTALKHSFPSWQISWLVEETSAPILQGHPYLSKLFVVNNSWRKKQGASFSDYIKGLNHIRNVRKKLRAERFDVAIDLQGLFKSGLWTWFSGAPRRIGHNKTREFAHRFLTEFVSARPVFDPSFPLVDRYLEPAKYLKADISEPEYLLPQSPVEAVFQVNTIMDSIPRPSVIAFCPWSAWPSKNWPLDQWEKLGIALSQNYEILIVGSSADKEAADHLCGVIPHSTNIAGRMPLHYLPELFRRCKIVIGPDSGPIHIANATGVPKILMLFGSTSWKRSGPLGKKHMALSTNLPCQPCFERICPLKHLNCQHQLTVEHVLDAVHTLEKKSSE